MKDVPEDLSQECSLSPIELDIKRVCNILGNVADGFPADSAEARAIAEAAIAYQVVQFHRHMKQSFDKWRSALRGEMTNEMIDEMNASLRRNGIDPDEFEDEAE